MRLAKIRERLREANIRHEYREEFGCGSVDFVLRGIGYHIWEFPPEERAAESNLRRSSRMEVFEGDYEPELLALLEGLL